MLRWPMRKGQSHRPTLLLLVVEDDISILLNRF
jgi:hypothetical protein